MGSVTTHKLNLITPLKLNPITLSEIRFVTPPKLDSTTPSETGSITSTQINSKVNTQSISNNKEIRSIYISFRNCDKIYKSINNKIIKEGDITTIIGKREMNKMLLLEIKYNNKSYNVCANYWLKLIFKNKEHKNCFNCLCSTYPNNQTTRMYI
jgi:hypothetical protein